MEATLDRWVMSRPSAIATHPGLSLIPVLASVDDASFLGVSHVRLGGFPAGGEDFQAAQHQVECGLWSATRP